MNEYSVYINGSVNTDIFPREFSNQIYFSDYAKLYLEYKSIYSIKYQISGLENYKLDNKLHQIHSNKYLVVNNDQDVICLTGCSEKAISIFIEPELMTDVFNNCKRNNEDLLSNPFDFSTDEPMFFECCYQLEDNSLSQLLREISKSFDTRKNHLEEFNISFFFKVAESLILSQQETFNQIKNIASIKRSTKDELFRRMVKAKDFIVENWQKKISVVLLARLVCMSPFHFHRTFSSVFGISPLRYHNIIRMKKAKDLLEKELYSVTEIAILSGYGSVPSFSKAFKKEYGTSPSKAIPR